VGNGKVGGGKLPSDALHFNHFSTITSSNFNRKGTDCVFAVFFVRDGCWMLFRPARGWRRMLALLRKKRILRYYLSSVLEKYLLAFTIRRELTSFTALCSRSLSQEPKPFSGAEALA